MKSFIQVFVLSLILIVFTFDAHAQKEKRGERVGGIRFGYHQSAFFTGGNELTDAEPMQTFYVGYFKEKRIVSLLRYGYGLDYFQNGIKYNDDDKLALHYLSVPLNLKFKIGPVFALTGFAPSFKIAEKVFTDGNSQNPAEEEKSEWFDIPFYAGAGLKIWFVTIEARYHWGLIEVNNGLKSQYFQLGAGFSF